MSMIPETQTVKIGNGEFTLHEPTNADLIEFCKWCRQERVREVADFSGRDASKPAELSALLNEIKPVRWGDEVSLSFLQDANGMARLVFQCLHGKGGAWADFVETSNHDIGGVAAAVVLIFRMVSEQRKRKEVGGGGEGGGVGAGAATQGQG